MDQPPVGRAGGLEDRLAERRVAVDHARELGVAALEQLAQLKNQDPLSPMDNAQFTTQLAQISTVQGIDNLQAQYEKTYGPDVNYTPYVPVTYWGFRLMIGLGMVAALYALWALFALRGGRVPKSRFFGFASGAILFFPLFGISAGWIFTEMGRQPWIVFGEQITADGISPLLTPFEVWVSMIGFTLLYAVLAIVEVALLLKYIKAGAPEAPVEDPYGDAKKDDDKQLYFAY